MFFLLLFLQYFVASYSVRDTNKDGSKVSFQECDIPAYDRLDCGYFGINVEECQSRGCCWQPSALPGVNWCYHSNKNALDVCVAVGNQREDCGYYGIHSRECTDGGCCWMPTQAVGAPWCFYSAGPMPGDCGVPAITPSVDTRIVGGETAIPHSWPWQISLNVGGYHWCGGSLINNRWVVSAAHCAPGDYYDDMVVIVLGAHNKDVEEDTQVRMAVEEQFVYPDYDPYSGDQDIMLFKLAEEVEFTDEISVVCLPPAGEELTSGLIVQTSGWGTLELWGETPSELQQLTMNVYSNEECEESGDYYSRPLTDNMICAGYMEAGKASCHGDSGGPLVKLVDGRWTLFGTVSWGYPCARENHPTLYTKVINYLDWIEETIANNS